MIWQHDDGGRSAAGYRGDARDCTVRAIAIAAELPYQQVYDDLNALSKMERCRPRHRRSSSREGVSRRIYETYLSAMGWTWVPTMQIGQGCTVHLRAEELPQGRLIIRASRHLCAVIDGVVHDTHDPTRDGTRCVYGYWQRTA